MEKLLILTSCCIIIAASELDTNNFLSFQDAPKPGHLEAVKDEHMQKLFAQLLGKRSLHVGPEIDPLHSQSAPSPPNGLPEVMFLHKQLQNKLGWGSDDNNVRNNNNNQQYGPPGPPPNQQYGPPPPPQNQQYGPPGPPPNQQYGPPPPPQNQQYGPPGPPPNQQYGPPPPPPNQQYGPPPSSQNQQYGPPPPPPNQQYGPPGPPPNQQYGPPPPPPNQQYGPPPSSQNQQYGPPPPNQQYGPPPSPPNQQYGPPPSPPNQQQNQPSQEYGPPSNDNKLRVNQGTFGGHIENFKLTDAIRNNNKNKDHSRPPPSKSAPSSQYGSPTFSDNSGYNDNGLDDGSSDNAKIYKHVYIHTPPHEQEDELAPRVIRPNKKQDTHYQIIFVKAPGPAKQAPTEIELPSPPERKTLVYVLVKKPEKPAEIKFRTPNPTQPAKPEVYFIRYKGNSKGKNGDGAQDLLSQIDSKDIIPSNSRPSRLNDVDNDDGYSLRGRGGDDDNGYSLRGRGGDADNIISNILTSRTKDRNSVGYPNAEYRAPPSMLSPNEEPMSFAVYDRVRNEKVPSNSAGGLVTSASDVDLIVRRSSRKYEQKRGGSHYTAPGSLPFERASGRMTNGQYLGMTSNVLRNQYYSPQDDVK